MSWLDISVWLTEQKQLLEGAFIDNVYIYSRELVVLRLRKSGLQGHYYLVIEPGKRVSVTATELRFAVSEGLTSLWRAHIRDCKVLKVSQYDKERIIIFELLCGAEKKHLIVELLPRGTLILTRPSMEIILALESKKMKDRVIAPRQVYRYPPKMWEQDIEEVDIEKVMNFVTEKKQHIVAHFIKVFGLPSEVVEEAFTLCNIDKKSIGSSISASEVMCVVESARNVIKKVIENPKPCIVYAHGTLFGFYPFVPSFLAKLGDVKLEEFQTFNEAVNKYFEQDLERLIVEERIASIVEEVERLRHTLQNLEKELQKRRERLELLAKTLRTFEERYPELEHVHECVRKTVKLYGWSSVKMCRDDITDYDESSGRYRIAIDGIEIELNVRLSLVELYNSYRKKLSDTEKDIKRIESEMERIRSEIDKMMASAEAEKKSVKLLLQRSREWYEKFNWMITSNGFLVIGGRDAQQNTYLIKRFVEDKDIVLHADIHGGSTVVIKTHGKEVDETSLREAAVLAACYSKAWKLGLHAIDVFWVQGSQVSLSPPPGQYLPRGGFMVYGKKNYVQNVSLELAIGIEVSKTGDKCFVRIVVGSPGLVSKRCGLYFVIRPGEAKVNEVIEAFLSELDKVGLGFIAKAIDIGELRSRIPGKSRIVKIVVTEESKKVLEKC